MGTFCQTEEFTMTKLFSSVMSLPDDDVGAYYNRLKQWRLSKAAVSSSFEEHNEALAISRGTRSSASAGLQGLLGRIS